LALAIAGDKSLGIFGMGEVETAAPSQQELAAHRGHGVVHPNRDAAAGQHLGGHEAGRTAPYDGHFRRG
jgi:hypothetical protein